MGENRPRALRSGCRRNMLLRQEMQQSLGSASHHRRQAGKVLAEHMHRSSMDPHHEPQIGECGNTAGHSETHDHEVPSRGCGSCGNVHCVASALGQHAAPLCSLDWPKLCEQQGLPSVVGTSHPSVRQSHGCHRGWHRLHSVLAPPKQVGKSSGPVHSESCRFSHGVV